MEHRVKRIGVLGSGTVGKTLATGLLKHGYEVLISSRDVSKLTEWHSANSEGHIGSVEQAIDFGDVLVLAVKGRGAETLVKEHSDSLGGKTILDATNPLSDSAPQNGVLSFFTDLNESLMERLQENAPRANFVKAWNSIGNQLMVDPGFSTRPTMFICGNSEEAKGIAKEILGKLGWEVEDLGKVESARIIEPLCILWCLPGFLGNGWDHAFKLLRK